MTDKNINNYSIVPYADTIWDARSRVTLYALSHLNDNGIEKLGNFSKVAGYSGIVAANGHMALTGTPTGILASWEQYNLNDYLPIKRYQNILPEGVLNVLDALDQRQHDWEFVARELDLKNLDPDKVSNQICTRIFCDDNPPILVPGGIYESPVYDSDGKFLRRNVILAGHVFTVKYYKLIGRPYIFPLVFKPTTTDIFVPKKCDETLLTTDTNIFTANLNCGLISANGNLDACDWRVLLNPKSVSLIWKKIVGNERETRNSLEQHLAILAAAKQKGVDIKTLKAEIDPNNMYISLTEINVEELSRDQIFDFADAYRITLDPILCPAERIRLAAHAPFESTLPYFWENGFITVFKGHDLKALLVSLLVFYSRRRFFPNKNILVIVPGKCKALIKKKLRNNDIDKVNLYDSALLQKRARFVSVLHQEDAGLVFIASAEMIARDDLVTCMDVCADRGIPCGLFFHTDTTEDVGELADQTYWSIQKEDNIFILKDMETNKIQKYDFTKGNEIKCSEFSEEEIKAIERKRK